MSDIEQRLREAHPISQQYANASKILLEAADEITRLQAENEALRAEVIKRMEQIVEMTEHQETSHDNQ